MSNFRLRRLQSDYEAVKRLVHLHPKIEVEGVSGNPPDRYRLVLRVRSLREQGDKIDLAREGAISVVELAYQDDLLGLIAFSDASSAEWVFELRPATDRGNIQKPQSGCSVILSLST